MRVPSRIWFLLAAIWIFGALALFAWVDQAMMDNVAAIACGYPDAKGLAYDSCFAAAHARASTGVWRVFFEHDLLWVVLPAVGLLLLGGVMARFRRGAR